MNDLRALDISRVMKGDGNDPFLIQLIEDPYDYVML